MAQQAKAQAEQHDPSIVDRISEIYAQHPKHVKTLGAAAMTIALSHLIFEGTLDTFPKLKICSAHGGGYIASYMDRSDHGCLTFPHRCNRPLNKRPTEYPNQRYYDPPLLTPRSPPPPLCDRTIEGKRGTLAACNAIRLRPP